MNNLILAAIACAGILCAQENSDFDNEGRVGHRDGHPAVPLNARGEFGLRPHVWMRPRPSASATTTGNFSPAQINGAYGTRLAGAGQGVTVAIIDAYNSPTVVADLQTFSSTYGIACSAGGAFKVVNQNGGAIANQTSTTARTSPAYNSGWEVEIHLDVQWVHAVAPCANIVLVEANSSNTSDLMTAVNYGKSIASVVSMSWGGGESRSQTIYDGYFVKSGVTFLASSGDTGGKVEWPSSSPNVVGVGGTNLTLGSGGGYGSEVGWSGSGGGCSTVEPAIPAQKGFVPSTCKNRATPDVSIDGGEVSAVSVLISNQGGWYDVWGTSLAVQLWAGVVAIGDGIRGSGLSSTLSDLYADATASEYSSNYNDVTSGTAGRFTAGTGWDFVTGLGTPKVASLVPGYLSKQQ